MCILTLGRVLSIVAISLTLVSQATWAADVVVQLGAADGFVIQDNTGAIERLRVDEATGNISRNGALFVHTTGTGNTFVGEGAGSLATSGAGLNVFNSAFGFTALMSNTTGSINSAFGYRALRSNTEGHANAAFGDYALELNTTGDLNHAFGSSALRANTTGRNNSAFGRYALRSNNGSYNSAFGSGALLFNTTGINNSAFGSQALTYNYYGFDNSAFGHDALQYNHGYANSAFGSGALRSSYPYSTGSGNSAFGALALAANTSGGGNAAFGISALASNSTGSRNVAIGKNAGQSQTTGNDNIYISNDGIGGESGQIRIGAVGTHTQATIAGIHGNTSSGGIAVLVNSSGTLGTSTSSLRFKQGVRDMGEVSEVLMKLRPVVFRYREEVADGADTPQYGLIAEEVAEVAPELVAYDTEGQPYSVRYHVLPSLLLNEMQNQQRVNEEQRQVIAALADRLGQVEEKLAAAPTETDR